MKETGQWYGTCMNQISVYLPAAVQFWSGVIKQLKKFWENENVVQIFKPCYLPPEVPTMFLGLVLSSRYYRMRSTILKQLWIKINSEQEVQPTHG